MADTDLVEVIWSGPFHADGANIGDPITVPRHQAEANPGWYRPITKAKPAVIDEPETVRA